MVTGFMIGFPLGVVATLAWVYKADPAKRLVLKEAQLAAFDAASKATHDQHKKYRDSIVKEIEDLRKKLNGDGGGA